MQQRRKCWFAVAATGFWWFRQWDRWGGNITIETLAIERIFQPWLTQGTDGDRLQSSRGFFCVAEKCCLAAQGCLGFLFLFVVQPISIPDDEDWFFDDFLIWTVDIGSRDVSSVFWIPLVYLESKCWTCFACSSILITLPHVHLPLQHTGTTCELLRMCPQIYIPPYPTSMC